MPLALARVPRSLQGTAIGVFGSYEDLGQIVGPVLIGHVYSASGPSTSFILVAVVAAAGALAAATLRALEELS